MKCPACGCVEENKDKYGDYEVFECKTFGTYRVTNTVLTMAQHDPKIFDRIKEIISTTDRREILSYEL
ncbi:hypothetical protein SR67_10390 [Klebsiella aerogenes]|nr:hypothetical protein SR67_10390 [Klebsiella aerogenes]